MAKTKAQKDVKRPRVNFDLSDEASARMLEMQKMMGDVPMREVIRSAFHLLNWYLDRVKRQGYSLQLAKGDKIVDVDLII